MPAEEKDAEWVRQILRAHTDHHRFDPEAFADRVLSEARKSRSETVDGSDGLPSATNIDLTRSRTEGTPRRRLLPVLAAAASLLIAVTVSSSVPAVARWMSQDGRTVVGGAVSSPSISLGESPSLDSGAPSPPTSSSPSGPDSLPSRFRWKSGGPLPLRQAGADALGAKDPTVVRHGNRWHLFVTVPTAGGFDIAYLSFADWSEAASATPYRLNTTALGAGYRAAPQVFYFAPQKLWYLVFQTGNASYSTNPDISDPTGWSAPRNFYSQTPDLIRKATAGGYWLDMWVICDSSFCYLFSSDNNGHLFRSGTTVADFPRGMNQPVVALQGAKSTPFAASNVYRIEGKDQYLLLSQGYGPDGLGYFRSWTSSRITGPWTPLADTPENAFAGFRNIEFTGAPWVRTIGQGELIRAGYDQTLTIDPCRLNFLVHGPAVGPTGSSTWQVGLLTQTNSACE